MNFHKKKKNLDHNYWFNRESIPNLHYGVQEIHKEDVGLSGVR